MSSFSSLLSARAGEDAHQAVVPLVARVLDVVTPITPDDGSLRPRARDRSGFLTWSVTALFHEITKPRDKPMMGVSCFRVFVAVVDGTEPA